MSDNPLKDIFLAGVGALSIGAEKTQEVIEQLVEKGQISVDQGKEIAADLKDKAVDGTSQIRTDIIKAQMKTMTKEERDDLAAYIADLASEVDSEQAMEKQEADEVKAAEK